MKDKVKIGLILTICLILCAVIQYVSHYVFDILIFGLSMLATIEFRKLQLKMGYPSFYHCPELACLLVFSFTFFGFIGSLTAIQVLLVVLAVLLVFYLVLNFGSYFVFKKELENDEFRKATNMDVKTFARFKANNTILCALYPVFLMFFMYLINHISEEGFVAFENATSGAPMGLFGIILLFSITSLTDTFAMLFGMLIKGKKLCPAISPKKTISGAIFGIFGGIIASLVVFFVFKAIFPVAFSHAYFWQFLVVGFLGSVVAQVGDLFESFLKRKAQVKDAGDIFRSHGGVLDRIDSAIFAGPFIFVCLLFIFG